MSTKIFRNNIRFFIILSMAIFLAGCVNDGKEKTDSVKKTSVSKKSVHGDDVENYVKKGIEQYNKGEYQEAVEALNRAYELDSKDNSIRENLVTVYINYGVKLVNEKNFETAGNLLEEALETFPEEPQLKKIYARALSEQAILEYDAGNSIMAVELLENAVRYDGKTAEVFRLLGNIHYKNDDHGEAISCWEKALELNPSLSGIAGMLNKLKREGRVESSFQTQELEHFEVRFNGVENYNFAWDVLKLLDDAYYEIGGEFDVLPPKKYTVIIYTGGEFEKAMMVPDWIRGLYDGRIRIRIGDLKGNTRQLKELLYHEYTHALLHYMLGSGIPIWLNEGISQYEEPDSSLLQEEEALLRSKLSSGALLSLADIERVIGNKTASIHMVSLGYIQSKSLMHYISDRFNRYSVRLIVHEFMKTKDINEAIKTALGIDINQLEADWKKSLQ